MHLFVILLAILTSESFAISIECRYTIAKPEPVPFGLPTAVSTAYSPGRPFSQTTIVLDGTPYAFIDLTRDSANVYTAATRMQLFEATPSHPVLGELKSLHWGTNLSNSAPLAMAINTEGVGFVLRPRFHANAPSELDSHETALARLPFRYQALSFPFLYQVSAVDVRVETNGTTHLYALASGRQENEPRFYHAVLSASEMENSWKSGFLRPKFQPFPERIPLGVKLFRVLENGQVLVVCADRRLARLSKEGELEWVSTNLHAEKVLSLAAYAIPARVSGKPDSFRAWMVVSKRGGSRAVISIDASGALGVVREVPVPLSTEIPLAIGAAVGEAPVYPEDEFARRYFGVPGASGVTGNRWKERVILVTAVPTPQGFRYRVLGLAESDWVPLEWNLFTLHQ